MSQNIDDLMEGDKTAAGSIDADAGWRSRR